MTITPTTKLHTITPTTKLWSASVVKHAPFLRYLCSFGPFPYIMLTPDTPHNHICMDLTARWSKPFFQRTDDVFTLNSVVIYSVIVLYLQIISATKRLRGIFIEFFFSFSFLLKTFMKNHWSNDKNFSNVFYNWNGLT